MNKSSEMYYANLIKNIRFETSNDDKIKEREMGLIYKVEQLWEHGDYDFALKILKAYRNENPNSVLAIIMMASTYYAHEDITTAVDYYKMYVDMNGGLFDAYKILIELLTSQSRDIEADHYKKLLESKFKFTIV